MPGTASRADASKGGLRDKGGAMKSLRICACALAEKAAIESASDAVLKRDFVFMGRFLLFYCLSEAARAQCENG